MLALGAAMRSRLLGSMQGLAVSQRLCGPATGPHTRHTRTHMRSLTHLSPQEPPCGWRGTCSGLATPRAGSWPSARWSPPRAAWEVQAGRREEVERDLQRCGGMGRTIAGSSCAPEQPRHATPGCGCPPPSCPPAGRPALLPAECKQARQDVFENAKCSRHTCIRWLLSRSHGLRRLAPLLASIMPGPPPGTRGAATEELVSATHSSHAATCSQPCHDAKGAPAPTSRAAAGPCTPASPHLSQQAAAPPPSPDQVVQPSRLATSRPSSTARSQCGLLCLSRADP